MDRKRTTNAFVGSPVERIEDLRFLRGRGQYVDDLARDDLLHAVILRSSVAHGRIRSIDTQRRAAAPRRACGHHRGRYRRRDPDDSAAAGAAARVQAVRAAGDRARQGALCRRAGRGRAGRQRRALAEDALDAIVLDIEAAAGGREQRRGRERRQSCCSRRPAAISRSRSPASRATPTPRSRDAAYVRRERFEVQRHSAVPMEPRGLLAEWDEAQGRLTVIGRRQGRVPQPARAGEADGAARERDHA